MYLVECIQPCLQLFNNAVYITFACHLGISDNALKITAEKPGISLLGDVVKVAEMTNYVADYIVMLSHLECSHNSQTNKQTNKKIHHLLQTRVLLPHFAVVIMILRLQ